MANQSEIKTGVRVVRSKGDYVIGRTGIIIDTDTVKNRAQVDWDNAPRSWVAFGSLELENKPYEIIHPSKTQQKEAWAKGRSIWSKYKAL